MRLLSLADNLRLLRPIVFLLIAEPLLSLARSSCPSQSASKCFNKFFSTYRFMQWPTCQTFDYMEKCFNFAQCDTMELAHLCSVEYRKINNNYLPKEAILAVYENLRQRCDSHCHRKSEQECSNRLSMNLFSHDRDQALIMEIKALKRQLDLAMSSPSVACQQITSALRRLNTNRKNICSESSVFCLCRRLMDDLPRSCNFRCDSYKNRKNRGYRPISSIFLTVIAAIILFWVI